MNYSNFRIIFILFFTSFNLLEASLPSLIAKTANAEQKGTAMGVYSSSQFMGAFAGGTVGGLAHNTWGVDGAYMTALAMLSIWLLIAIYMKKPRNLSTYLMNVADVTEQNLLAVRGVVEATIIKDEGVAYLKVQKNILDEEKLLSDAEFASATLSELEDTLLRIEGMLAEVEQLNNKYAASIQEDDKTREELRHSANQRNNF